jgi:hypothetical protein
MVREAIPFRSAARVVADSLTWRAFDPESPIRIDSQENPAGSRFDSPAAQSNVYDYPVTKMSSP